MPRLHHTVEQILAKLREAEFSPSKCSLPNGANVNHTLVKAGWCWWYRKYASGNTVLEGLEKKAREAKKGLRADPAHIPPWEWRKRR